MVGLMGLFIVKIMVEWDDFFVCVLVLVNDCKVNFVKFNVIKERKNMFFFNVLW